MSDLWDDLKTILKSCLLFFYLFRKIRAWFLKRKNNKNDA